MSDADAKKTKAAKKKGDAAASAASASEPDSILYLLDADGNEHPHELLEVLDVGENAYAALLILKLGDDGRADIDDDNTELTFLRIEYDEGDEEILVEIDDAAEIDAVFDAWTTFLDALDV